MFLECSRYEQADKTTDDLPQLPGIPKKQTEV